MEFFGTVLISFYFLIIATKNSILDTTGAQDPTPVTYIFSLHTYSWILINLKSILASYRNRLINSNGKDGWLL